MLFAKRNGWEVRFSDLETGQPMGRSLRFNHLNKLREIAHPGRAFAYSRNWHAMDRMLAQGQGTMILTLTVEQFDRLSRSLKGRAGDRGMV